MVCLRNYLKQRYGSRFAISCLSLLGLLFFCLPLIAQDLNPSHRVIEGMPQDLSALHSQLNFLKQLQKLGQIDSQQMTSGQHGFPNGQNPLENLDPEMLKELQKVAEQFGKQPQNSNGKSGNESRNPQQTGQQNPFDARRAPDDQASQQQRNLESMLQSLSERTGIPLDEMFEKAKGEQGSSSANQNNLSSSANSPRIRPARRPENQIPRESGISPNRRPKDDNGLFTNPDSQPEAALPFDANSNQIDQRTNRSTGSSSTVDPNSIQEFQSDILKQLDRLNSPGMMPRQSPPNNNQASLQPEGDSPDLQNASQESIKSHSDELSNSAKNVIEELRESPAGVREKLRSIMNYAKQQSQETSSSSSLDMPDLSAPEGLKTALSTALESTAQQMFSNAENLPQGNSQASPSQQQRPSPRSRSSSKPSRNRFKAWEKATSEFMSNISQAPAKETGSSATSVAKAVPRTWQDFPWMPLVALFVGAGLAYVALLLFRKQNAYSLDASAIKALPDKMQSRDDVIRAFHTIVGRSLAPTEYWWPHRRAADAVGASSPNVKWVMKSFCTVYESARYMPQDYPLTQQQLETARTAVATMKAEV